MSTYVALDSRLPVDKQDDSFSKFKRDHSALLKYAEDCLSKCLHSHHVMCKRFPPEPHNFLPSRLLDISDFRKPRIVETYLIEPEDYRYISLSHRWGNPGHEERELMTTLQSNLDLRKQEMDLASLPERYQMAILLTYALGIRYLWIDSLCIIQDSPEDLEIQCSLMGRIYESGILTICSNFTNEDSVLLADQDEHDLLSKLKFRQDLNRQWLERKILTGALAQRAWCLQERHLSPRMIHVFPGPSWIWECSLKVRGMDSSGALGPGDVMVNNPVWSKLRFQVYRSGSMNVILESWDKILHDYTRRVLTYDADRLQAIAGIADRLQHPLSQSHYAGMWSGDIYGLMWHCDEFIKLETTTLPPELLDLSRIGVEHILSRAPSWSWASINRPVTDLSIATSSERDLILGRIRYYNTTTRESFVNLAECHTLSLSGLTIKAHFLSSSRIRHMCEIGLVILSLDETPRPWGIQSLVLNNNRLRDKIFYAILGTGHLNHSRTFICGLVLHRLDSGDTYIRLGIFKIYTRYLKRMLSAFSFGDSHQTPKDPFENGFGEKRLFVLI